MWALWSIALMYQMLASVGCSSLFWFSTHIPLYASNWWLQHLPIWPQGMWLMPLSTLLSPHHDWQASPKMPTCKFCPRNMLPYTAKRTLQMESEKVKVAQSCPTLCDPMDYMGCSPWDSPGQNTGVGSLSLLQGIFSTQGLNPGLPHCRQTLTNWATRKSLQMEAEDLEKSGLSRISKEVSIKTQAPLKV